MTANDDRIDAPDWSLLAVLSVLWGGSFFFNGVVLKELPPLTVVLLRVALAAMILLPVLRAYQIRFPVGLSGWKPFFAIALLNNVLPFSLIVIGQTYIPSGLASILNATTPLFTVLVMAAAGDEKLHARRVVGIVTGLIGVIILHGQDLHGQGVHGQDLGFQAGEGVGILLCLAAAFSYGLAALCARRKLSNSPPLATATFQLLASSLMMTIIAAVFERPWQLPMPGANDVAGDDGPRRIVDCAGLYRIFPRVAALGLDQRHAGDASRSGDGYSARLSRAGRKHLAARDRRRPRDRQRAAADRRARAQFRPARACNSIAPSPATRARPRPQGTEPPVRAAAILFEGADAHRTGIRANHAPLLAI